MNCSKCHDDCVSCEAGERNNCIECKDERADVFEGACICRAPFEDTGTLTVECNCPLNSFEKDGECFCDEFYYDKRMNEEVVCERCPDYCSGDC